MVWKQVGIPPHRFVSRVWKIIAMARNVPGYGTEFGRCFTSFGFNLPHSRLRKDLRELDSTWVRHLPSTPSTLTSFFDEPGSDILSGFGQMVACSLLRLHKQTEETRNFHGTKRVNLHKSYKHSMKVQGLVPLLFDVFGLDVLGFILFCATLSKLFGLDQKRILWTSGKMMRVDKSEKEWLCKEQTCSSRDCSTCLPVGFKLKTATGFLSNPQQFAYKDYTSTTLTAMRFKVKDFGTLKHHELKAQLDNLPRLDGGFRCSTNLLARGFEISTYWCMSKDLLIATRRQEQEKVWVYNSITYNINSRFIQNAPPMASSPFDHFHL